MRKLLVLLTTLMAALPAVADETDRVFLFVRDGSRDLSLMLTQEVGVMRTMLEDAGYAVDIATTSGEPMVADGVTLNPNIELAEVDASNYVGIVLPCMAPAQGHAMPAAVDNIIAEATELGLPMAASRGSVAALAQAGALRGHRYAYAGAVDLEERPEFAGGEFMGIGVVRDRKISTAGICPLASRSLGEPDGTVDLMRSFIASLNEQS